MNLLAKFAVVLSLQQAFLKSIWLRTLVAVSTVVSIATRHLPSIPVKVGMNVHTQVLSLMCVSTVRKLLVTVVTSTDMSSNITLNYILIDAIDVKKDFLLLAC